MNQQAVDEDDLVSESSHEETSEEEQYKQLSYTNKRDVRKGVSFCIKQVYDEKYYFYLL